MAHSFRSMSSLASILAGALALAASTGFGQAPPSAFPTLPRIDAGETVEVEVKIVPFYAIDDQGKPVYDLRKEEVELRVGGVPVPLDSFDSYAIASGKRGGKALASAPAPSRTIFFLFDATFSSLSGFQTGKKLAASMIEGWPAGDRLFLITHGTRAGLEKRLGPVSPDSPGKRELLAAIEALQPEVRRVETQNDPTADYGAPVGRASRSNMGNAPDDQMVFIFDNIQGAVRGEYHSIARDLAVSLQGFAGELRHISGPKLLVIFSQGISNALYFEGSNGNTLGSNENLRVDTRRAPPLMDRFREPLLALADSGTLSLFVNTDRNISFSGDESLHHMATTTGGLYLEGRDPRSLEARAAASTAAYYEAGFRPVERMLGAERAEVEVVVHRPGVRAWAPSSVKTRESYRSMSDFEKRRLVIDLVAGGPEAQRAHASVPLKLHDLVGKVAGQASSGVPGLQFQAEWPAGVTSRKLDLYNVVLAPPEEGRKGRVLTFDRHEATAGPTDRGSLVATLTEKGGQVWGIVAIDPETEQVWMRRLMLRPPRPESK